MILLPETYMKLACPNTDKCEGRYRHGVPTYYTDVLLRPTIHEATGSLRFQ